MLLFKLFLSWYNRRLEYLQSQIHSDVLQACLLISSSTLCITLQNKGVLLFVFQNVMSLKMSAFDVRKSDFVCDIE